MSELVQNSLAVSACLAAGSFVAWRAWRSMVGRASGCGTGCVGCPTGTKSSAPKAMALLKIDAESAENAALGHGAGTTPGAKS